MRGRPGRPSAALDSTFAGVAAHEAQDPEDADLVVGMRGVGPGHVGAAVGAAVLPRHPGLQNHRTFGFSSLLQPADAACWEKGHARVRVRENCCPPLSSLASGHS